MKVQKQDFLTEGQKKCLEQQVIRLKQKIGKLPIKTTYILYHCSQFQSPALRQMREVDPQNSIFIIKMFEINQRYLYKQFYLCTDKIIQLLIEQKNIINQGQSLKNLQKNIQVIINTTCQTTQFYLDEGLPDYFDDKTWNQMYDPLTGILSKIIGFMHKKYEIQMNKVKRQHAITKSMQTIKDKIFEKSAKRQQVRGKLQESMIKKMTLSKLRGDDLSNQEYLKLFQFVDKVQQETQRQQQKQKQLSIELEQLKKSKSATQKQSSAFSKVGHLISNIKQKGRQIFKKVHRLVNPSSPYQQKQINEIAEHESMQNYLQNLQNQPYFSLKPQQRQQIQKVSQMIDIQILRKHLDDSFDASQMAIFKFSIDNVVHLWIQDQKCYNEESQIYQQSFLSLLEYSQKLLKSLKHIKVAEKAIIGNLKYFLKVLEENYRPLTKRYLMNVISKLQNQLHIKDQVYLRGALRIYQQKIIQPTSMASLLANQKPLRSAAFQQSQSSKVYVKNQTFQDPEKVMIELHKFFKEVQIKNKLQETPILELSRLSCASQTKNVTIVISGFLSEKSAKDLEWMGLIRALRETELYCLSWKSSTVKQLAECIGKMGQDMIFNPLSLAGPSLMVITNVARFAYQMYGSNKDNPFSQACSRASLTGFYLAELLISQFPDRFINLVGFSLGTQVVAACMNRLIEKNKVSLINRIVTIGGVADQQKIQNIMKKSSIGVNWINIWSKKDSAVRFLYRLTNFSQVPIGSSNFQGCSGHEFKCLQCNFVQGHMDFRCHLYGFGLLTGLNHD